MLGIIAQNNRMREDDFFDSDKINDISLINKLFAKENSRCVNKRDGLYACINRNCEIKNPFICSQIGNCYCSK